jgi:radical SAM-linked protein
MPRVRIHFSKTGYACFISHIDLPMLFSRAARRAGLTAEQTQGFSPRPKLALCPPLPVGVVGVSEPADFWFARWDDDSLGRWRTFLPPGIDIASAIEVDGPSLNKLCGAASYSIEPLARVETGRISEVLERSLSETGELLEARVSGKEIVVAVSDLERCGPSLMVKLLVESAVVSGWSDLSIARTAVGRWNSEESRVVPLAGGNRQPLSCPLPDTLTKQTAEQKNNGR